MQWKIGIQLFVVVVFVSVYLTQKQGWRAGKGIFDKSLIGIVWTPLCICVILYIYISVFLRPNKKGLFSKKAYCPCAAIFMYSVFMYFCKSVFLRSKIEVGKDFFGKANCPCLAGGGSGTTVVQLHFKEPRLV